MGSLSTAVRPTTPAANEHLSEVVAAAIHTATGWPVYGLAIFADDGLVTLRGRTRSFYEKQLVLHAARRVPGVRGIVDQVEVLPRYPR